MMAEVRRLDQDSQGDCIEGEEKRTSLGGDGPRMEVLQNGSHWGNLAGNSRVRSALEYSQSFDSLQGALPSSGVSKVLF